MTHLDEQLHLLKTALTEMWALVMVQLSRAGEALEKNDKDLAREVLMNEKRVDAFELKIDMDCENILALFNPVANDLRFVLAVLKINYNLERIGDYANTIVKIVIDMEKPFEAVDLEKSNLPVMFDTTLEMLSEALDSFVSEDIRSVKNIFRKDVKLDRINKAVNPVIAGLINQKPDDISNFLNLLSIIRKLERVGDQVKNIAEEIVFYINAMVLRHKKKKDKLS